MLDRFTYIAGVAYVTRRFTLIFLRSRGVIPEAGILVENHAGYGECISCCYAGGRVDRQCD